ncbi:MAG: amino acid ABC transporter substrate-binding protein, partial [Rubrivivax sp.]|nr:amino acid ABC transporter substrate-binding protein [Rubrivivax sp.]
MKLLSCIGMLLLATAAQANTLAKMAETASVTLGVREASGALSYMIGDGRYGGFHVELCQRVLADIQK